jgi:hypothetical protein
MSWHSLYLRTADSNTDAHTIATALIDSLHQYGYQRYDPFPGGTGTPPGLKQFVKQFVAPAVNGWVRILGEPDSKALHDLSTHYPVIFAWLTETDSGMTLYRDGGIDPEGLSAYLRPRQRLDAQPVNAAPTTADPSILPDEIQKLARDHNVNPDQANKMINRLTANLFGKLDRASGGEANAMQAQARALVSNRLDWSSPAAVKLQALAGALTLPSNWREPDFDAVREAYQVARRLHKNPRSQLMPDEQAAIKAVPNALEYQAIYAGK